MDYGKTDGGYLQAIKSDGTPVAMNSDGSCTLAVGTYYVPLHGPYSPGSEAAFVSAYLRWAAALAATITIELTNFPTYKGGINRGPGYDVPDYDTTAGNWTQYNASTSYVPVSGASNTSTAATVTAGGAAIGSAAFDIAGTGHRRWRIRLAVTVGGAAWVNSHGKLGS